MRVSREQAEENRQTVINTASQLFREHGFDGIGLKALMKGAGLTQGAFYKQFASKDDLIGQASERAFECSSQRWQAAIDGNATSPLDGLLALYLSVGHRDDITKGCPMVALGPDAARKGDDISAAFGAGVMERINVLRDLLGGSLEQEDDHVDDAMAALSMMVGALLLSRLVADADTSERVLNAAAEGVRSLAKGAPETPGSVQ